MKKQKNKQKWWLDGISGSVIGFINGFLGSGGGMIAVPLLEKLKKMDNKQAHATAIALMLPFSLISGLIYSLSFELNFVNLAILSASVTLGGVLGSLFLKKLSSKTIRIIFAIVMLGAGIKMFF